MEYFFLVWRIGIPNSASVNTPIPCRHVRIRMGMMTADSRVAFQTTSTGTELSVHGQTSVRLGDSSIVLEV